MWWQNVSASYIFAYSSGQSYACDGSPKTAISAFQSETRTCYCFEKRSGRLQNNFRILKCVRTFCNLVKLLISKTNVDQYEQIKDDVEELRTLTEESELWIPSCSVKATPEEEKKRRAYLHENIKKAKIIIRDSRIYFEDEVGSLQNFSPVNSCDFDRLESALGLETSKEASLNYKKLQVKYA